MHTTVEVDDINKKLKEKYGYLTDATPNFRIVWSDDQREWRHGNFVDMHNDIFLRAVTETRETKKYPHIKERWVLEKYFPNNQPELPWVKYSYEPLFVFQYASGKYSPPSLRIAEAILNIYLFSEKQYQSDETARQDYEADLAKEQQEVFEYLDDLTPELARALGSGEAVVVPENVNVRNNSVDVSESSSRTEAGVNS